MFFWNLNPTALLCVLYVYSLSTVNVSLILSTTPVILQKPIGNPGLRQSLEAFAVKVATLIAAWADYPLTFVRLHVAGDCHRRVLYREVFSSQRLQHLADRPAH